MPRPIQLIIFLIAVICSCGSLSAVGGELVPETVAARAGLTRDWFAQVELDRGRGRITDVIYRDGVLYAQTNAAVVHAIDAETGKTIWSQQIGRPEHPSMTPDALGGLLAVVNGSRLYLVDSLEGKLLREIDIKEAPGAGPAVSFQRVYVPMVSGMVVAYPLSWIDEPKREPDEQPSGEEKKEAAEKKTAPQLDRRITDPPLFCRSHGRALVQPLVTRDDPGGEYVVWPTDRGYLYFGRIDRALINAFVIKFRLETGSALATRPGYLPPDPQVIGDAGLVFGVSGDGFVYAVNEETGSTVWRFSTGEPIVETPALIGDRLYLATQLGGMYCLESKTGKNLWKTPAVVQFVAASAQRVYAVDRLGRLLIIDAGGGAQIDAVPIENVAEKIANIDTDRIYLYGRKGLIQCLREVEQVEPIFHDKQRKQAAKVDNKPAPKPEASPFGASDGDETEKEDADNPFG
ncbi:MAG: PQQ-binding-like beta-propeller repeat protein [Pirellulales bacterium]|nr:PQQ-binding-like beta-propeller repeat protein [Pirellulales bacterium]